MRKIILFASTLALSGSMAFAMEKDAMDEEMMMEAPAPSVTLGGSAKIGVKNVDDDTMPDADSMQLVRAYKVTFASSSTTDGGLMFGAGMSIRDDTGEKDVINDKGDEVQGPAVKGSYVFVGGADGSWKLQFGGNDPGGLLAGGIGMADDRIDRGDASISLSGSMQGVEYRLTMADPQEDSNDWSIGAKFSAGQIGVGVGMDSEDGLAIGVSTDVSGLSTTVYYAKSEGGDMVPGMTDAVDGRDGIPGIPAIVRSTADAPVYIIHTGDNFEDADNDPATPETLKTDADDRDNSKYVVYVEGGDYILSNPPDDDTAPTHVYMKKTRKEVLNNDNTVTITYDRIPITAVPAEGTASLTLAGTAVDVDDELVRSAVNEVPAVDDVPARETMTEVAGNWTGLGAKVAIPAGEGATISVGYSRMKMDVSADNMGSGSATSSRIELDFSYDLGGGATFTAGIDKDTNEKLMTNGNSFMTTSSGKTTLEAAISMSF